MARQRAAVGTVACLVAAGCIASYALGSGLFGGHTSRSGTAPAARAARSPSSRLAVLPRRALPLTPPMGWNGYNHFHLDVTAVTVETAARALLSSGMAAVGYTYVNLDGGWDLRQRDPQGNLQPDPRKFPDGIGPVAAYVHALGLKFGIYTSAGTANCAGTSVGSYQHYLQDAALFASWRVDYLKLDWCHMPYQDFPGMSQPEVSRLLTTQMGDALAATGRPIVYDVNDTTSDKTWGWAQQAANMWRTTADIQDSYTAMVRSFLHDMPHYMQARPGHWNDPDMLEVGNGGLSNLECQTQYSLWAELAAPLIAGNDLTTMSAATQAILTNAAVVAVDQDPLGRQGYAVRSAHGLWVLTKPLANGDRAVVLFNQTGTAATISTGAAQVGMSAAARYKLVNLWTAATATTADAITAVVPPHGVVMYRVTGDVDEPLSA